VCRGSTFARTGGICSRTGGALVDSLFDPSQVWLTDDPGIS
jgi:hypothetical protein